MLRITVDTKSFSSGFDAFARRQLPFAMAQTLNIIGRKAIEAERQAEFQELDRPRPFTTQQGLRLKAARKSDLEAIVYIPPIQSRYLAAEISGGQQVLSGSSSAVLRPIDQATDRYGNIPRSLLARLRGRPDIFVGKIHGVDGVWQRLTVRQAKRRGNAAQRVRLLVRFSDPVQVKTRYRFGEATLAVARAQLPAELRRQLALALRTAR
jgi:hypothetical protein